MATDDFKALFNLAPTLEALRNTKECCAWLVSIAEQADHPDAAAAARWLNHTGERVHLVLDEVARRFGLDVNSETFPQLTASAKSLLVAALQGVRAFPGSSHCPLGLEVLPLLGRCLPAPPHRRLP